MKYVYVLILFFCSIDSKAQTNEVNLADLRYSSILPGPANAYYQSGEQRDDRLILGQLAQKPGYTFLASAAIPGLGQAANKQWWKTGIFMALEATAIGIYLHKSNLGRNGERKYEQFADSKWSVVQYADWLVDTYGYDQDDVLNPEYQGHEEFPEPTFDTSKDWEIINIQGLREVERETTYTSGHSFSHDLPDYGSQQYYELVSKYHQYAPGWRDFENPFGENGKMDAGMGYFSPYGWEHAAIGYRFNDDLNTAGHLATLILVNHFVSAFDAFFTQKLRDNRIQASASMRNGPQLRLSYKF